MNIDYFNSDNHVYEQCKKIENLTNRRINIQKIKEMNVALFNRYYRRKPREMSDEMFLNRLSIKSIYDVCEKVIEEEKRKGRPVRIQQKQSYPQSIQQNQMIQSTQQQPIQSTPQQQIQPRQQTQQVINTNGETVKMEYQRFPQLQTNNQRVEAVNYQSMLEQSGVKIEKPNEQEVMNMIKENTSDWLNPRKSRTEPKEQQFPQQFNQQQSQQSLQQPQQELSAPNDTEFTSLDNQFGKLLSGISEEEKAKFNNNNPINSMTYSTDI